MLLRPLPRLIGVLAVLNGDYASAQATTIIARETGSWLLEDGGLEEIAPQFEVTYVISDSIITRVAVVDFKSGEVRPDNTAYRIITTPFDDMSALAFGTIPEANAAFIGPVIRAIGQPAPASIELLVIGPTFVRSVRSTIGFFAIADLERSR